MTDIVIYSAGPSHLIHNGSTSTKDSSSFSITNLQYNSGIQFSDVRSSINTMHSQNSSENFFNVPVQHRGSKTIFIERTRDTTDSPSIRKRESYSREPSEAGFVDRRRLSSAEQHYDYPADVIQRLCQKKNETNEIESTKPINRLLDSTATSTMPTIVPFNSFKPMNNLNTIFIRPTRIEQPLPKLVFQDSEIDEDEKVESKLLETSGLDESDSTQHESSSSSVIFYEQSGLGELEDEPEKHGRRVRFSTAPIRVYPTYSASEYDRRNEDIDPFSASAEYELEKRIERMDVFRVEIFKGPEGLGMSVLGMGVGADSGIEKLGIFVKSLSPQGLVAKDGRIQVGDQIIEVNENYMVGVTHQYATNVLRSTSGLISFLIGREKDVESSEIFRLIRRSLQMDQNRLQEQIERPNNAPSVGNVEREVKSISSVEYELAIMKECFTSMEKTLENLEKERDQYRKLYENTFTELEEFREKHKKATEKIQELEDREAKMTQEHTDRQKEQQKAVQELIKKIENLEEVIAAASKTNEKNRLEMSHENRICDNDSAVGTSPEIGGDQEEFEVKDKRSRPIERRENFSHFRSISVNSKLNLPDNILSEKATNTKQLCWVDFPSSIAPHCLPNIEYEHSIKNFSTVLESPSQRKDNHFEVEASNINESLTENEAEVKYWTSDRCIQWLTSEGLHSFVPIFIERNIDGEKLLGLDSSKMKAMRIKSSKERDRLKLKLKQLKQADLVQTRERFLSKPTTFERVMTQGKRFRSSSLTKLRDRHFFTTSTANFNGNK